MKLSEYRAAYSVVARTSDDLQRLIMGNAGGGDIDIAQKARARALRQFNELVLSATVEERWGASNQSTEDSTRPPNQVGQHDGE